MIVWIGGFSDISVPELDGSRQIVTRTTIKSGETPYDPLRIDEQPRVLMTTTPAVHPGAILRAQFMEPQGLSASGLAIRLHVPAPRVNDIVRERRGISPDSALRLARYFGTSPQYWMDLQTAYDLRVAAELAGEQIRREVAPASELHGELKAA